MAFLLAQGANPLLRDNEYRTALHQAVAHGKAHVVGKLLDDTTHVRSPEGLQTMQVLRDVEQRGVYGTARWASGSPLDVETDPLTSPCDQDSWPELSASHFLHTMETGTAISTKHLPGPFGSS